MKSDSGSEIDRLMRRFARRKGGALHTDGEGGAQEIENTAHLDADEMNAYAEGALPSNTRSRYFAHLADCDSCRKLVTELTLAAAPAEVTVDRAVTLEPRERGSWREWLRMIFSPPVLRYAVPALALLAVIVIAFVATRNQRDDSTVAHRSETGRAYAPLDAANSNSTNESQGKILEQHTQSNNTASPNVQTTQQAQATPAATPTSGPLKSGDVVTDSPATTPTDAAKPLPTPAAATKPGEEFGAVAKQAEREVNIATTRNAGPEPAAIAERTISDRADDQKKTKVEEKDEDSARTKTTGGAIATDSRTNESRTAAGRREAPQSQTLSVPPPAAPRRSAPGVFGSDKRDLSEIRNVAGRSFRRQGNAWVDTAYRSSLSTTHVARASEQYRALMADEPNLRTVTQQLPGEVFVVWKSRAYRFY